MPADSAASGQGRVGQTGWAEMIAWPGVVGGFDLLQAAVGGGREHRAGRGRGVRRRTATWASRSDHGDRGLEGRWRDREVKPPPGVPPTSRSRRTTARSGR
jgi:hypothetical protein